jgi:hypothetical protein
MIAASTVLATVVLGVFLAFWASRPTGQRELITAAMFLVGMAIATFGFWSETGPMTSTPSLVVLDQSAIEPPSELQRLSDAFHSSLQLLVLNVDAEHSRGPWLGIARILLPLAAAQVLLLVIVARTGQTLLRIRMALPWWSFDIVVLGCGETGLRIAEWYAREPGARLTPWRCLWKRLAVVGVDQDLTHPRAVRFQRRFATIHGSLESNETLRALHIGRRALVVICTGSDARDWELTRRMLERRPPGDLPGPRFVLSVESSAVARASFFDPVLRPWYDTGRLDFLNAAHATARLLLLKYPPHELHPVRFRAGGSEPCHIAIFGNGPLLFELIAQAARALVYCIDKATRITVLTPDANSLALEFYARFPSLSPDAAASGDPAYGTRLPIARVRFIDSSVEQVRLHALREADTECRVDAIYTVGKHGSLANLAAAEAIKASAVLASLPPVVVCTHEYAQETWTDPPGRGIRVLVYDLGPWLPPNGVPDRLEADVPGPDDYGDAIAKRLWWRYEHANVEPKPFNEQEAEAAWPRVPHLEKWWNRHAADHAFIKLRLLGLSGAPDEDAVREAVAAHYDWLVRLEHRRFVCERMTDGWICAPEPRLRQYQLNHTISPFKTLSDPDMQRDGRVVDVVADAIDVLRVSRGWLLAPRGR